MARRAGVFRFLTRIFAAIGLVTVLTLITPATTFLAHRLSGPILAPTAPLLIVLTGADPIDGMLSESTYWRAIYAIRAWRTGAFSHILLSGKQSNAMKQFLVSEGVPASEVDLDEQSASTHESAIAVAALLRGKTGAPPVLMTSDYHMYRASRCFEKAGLTVAPRPIPDAIKLADDWYNRPSVLAIEIEEACKVAGYRLRGWI